MRVAAAAMLAASVLGAPTAALGGSDRSTFSFGVTGERHSLKAGDGNELLGNSAAIQLGMGSVASSWYSLASLDIILGPYEPTRGGQLNVDYLGTGLTTWVGFSAQTLDLRSKEGGYGFALGMSYADVVGRSIGANRKDSGETGDDGKPAPEDADHIDEYTMRVTNFSLMPAIFFSWLGEARPAGNTPELLATRIEGYILTLGAAMPLLITYQAKYKTRDRVDPKTPSKTIEGDDVTDTGQLRGYSVLMTLTALLGT